jgi:hypothetical protein
LGVNPLRGASYRVYKVVDGTRTQFQALVLPEDLEWHNYAGKYWLASFAVYLLSTPAVD